MADRPQALRFTLPVQPTAPAMLRRRLRSVDQIEDNLRPDLELLLSEIVTNVVQHSGLGAEDSIDVHVRIAPGHVRAEVSDRGRGRPALLPRPVARPADESGTGYGLYLVDRIANRWGTLRGPGATVWFELRGLSGS